MQFLVIVNGYTEGKFSNERGSFTQNLPVLPAVGDLLLLEPGPTWGRIWCVVEHRKVDPVGVTLFTRLANEDDRRTFWAYGEPMD